MKEDNGKHGLSFQRLPSIEKVVGVPVVNQRHVPPSQRVPCGSSAGALHRQSGARPHEYTEASFNSSTQWQVPTVQTVPKAVKIEQVQFRTRLSSCPLSGGGLVNAVDASHVRRALEVDELESLSSMQSLLGDTATVEDVQEERNKMDLWMSDGIKQQWRK